MIRLFQILFFGHAHKWKIIREVKLVIPESEDNGRLEGRRYTIQCEKCGDVAHRDFI